MVWKTLVLTLFIVGAFGEFDLELNDDKRQQLKNMLKQQCERVNAADKTDEVANSVHAFVDCLKGLVDVAELKKEIEEAKPNGALDEVFKKYCAKTPQLKTCMHTVFDGVSPCLDDSSKQYISSAKNGTDQLIDFVCYKDGDRIALFIAEHGPECFAEKVEPIRECAKKVQGTVKNANDVEKINLVERCGKFDELSACIVTALEGCNTPTPGNMAESLFRYVRKSSPCNDALPKN